MKKSLIVLVVVIIVIAILGFLFLGKGSHRFSFEFFNQPDYSIGSKVFTVIKKVTDSNIFDDVKLNPFKEGEG